ncbi:nucleotidyltransferase domain-containing protein [Hyalangium rubrum]|uniref:Nucleotidyltransferase domain-containing protein n=1 Tax=Hyalangium rubrum TaxID=3103134 RepID=A0ABU5H2F8_9BACT|nr:nucleotidyltransferase domain-containing protein [Hyalangium sp. s54d21]MDY7227660.1 nucleotidyltransferase domain-containing protein [Hyalangium sp. s54d21]
MTTLDSRLEPFVQRHPYPLVFMTVSGSHIYGFPSPDSDWDLRGVHVLPAREVVGLDTGPDTVEQATLHEGLEMDLVTHDVSKFFALLLRRNGYVLEQLFSPLVLRTSPEHQELKALGGACITRHHAHHYLGFSETQWRLFEKENPRRVKPLLYVYRVLLTGIHLMRTGRVEPNLVTLNEEFRLPYIPELVERKLSGPEKGTLPEGDFAFHEREFQRLRGELERARDACTLPEAPSGRAGLHDLLVRLRLASAR